MNQLQFITTEEELQRVLYNLWEKAAEKLQSKSTQPESVPNEILDTKELSKRLKVDPITIHRWTKRGKITAIMVGTAVRYNYYDVIQELKKQKKGGKL